MNWIENTVLDLLRLALDYHQLKYSVPARVTLPDGRIVFCQKWQSLEIPVGYLRPYSTP